MISLGIQADLGGMKPAKAGSLPVFTTGYPEIDSRVMTGTPWFPSTGTSKGPHVFNQWWLNILYALSKSYSGKRRPICSSLIVLLYAS